MNREEEKNLLAELDKTVHFSIALNNKVYVFAISFGVLDKGARTVTHHSNNSGSGRDACHPVDTVSSGL